MKNLYKRMDVFRCNGDGHRRFENAVSVYHVLRERRCYPEGCLYFLWKCRHPLGEKGCSQGFRHVGRMCLSCPHFYDEKVVRYPRLLLPSREYHRFLGDLRSFEGWLQEVMGREVSVWGVINSVKPHFKEVIHPRGSHVVFQGFLLNFREAYLNLVQWEDLCYATIGKGLQALRRFRRKDQVSFRATVRMDRGRLILHRLRAIETEAQGEGEFWTESKALLAQRLGRSFSGQPERCLACERGALLDVMEDWNGDKDVKRDRRLFCLEGISDPDLCSFHAEAELASAGCESSQEGGSQANYEPGEAQSQKRRK